VIYQIYTRSFQDTNGDGIGDLKGSSGGSTIWPASASTRSGSRPSTLADGRFGYDVADYCGIDSRFGALDDFDDLLAQAMRAAQGPARLRAQPHVRPASWFVESRSSCANPKRTGTSGAIPPRWRPPTTGSAISAARLGVDEATSQYYYHAFLKEQRTSTGVIRPCSGDVRRDALLVRPRRGRLPHRRAVAHVKAADFLTIRPTHLSASDGRYAPRAPAPFDRPARGARIAADMRAIADNYGARDGANAC